MRTCEIAETIELQTGDTIRIAGGHTPEGGFRVSYEDFAEEVPVESAILIDDGEIQLIVTGTLTTFRFLTEEERKKHAAKAKEGGRTGRRNK